MEEEKSENIIIKKYPSLINDEDEYMKKKRISMARNKSSVLENKRKIIMEENNKIFIEIKAKNMEIDEDEDIVSITEELNISMKEFNIKLEKMKRLMSDIDIKIT